jgi:N-acetylglucosaminyldiphosphoundecaprenol N-acetyl-beta-D-mannosaminyltransferase
MGIPYVDLAEEEARLLPVRRAADRLGIVARAAVASLLSPSASARREPRPWIVSAHVDNVTIDQALDAIVETPPPGRARIIHFVHPHALNVAAANPELAGRLARADFVLPDGTGIRVAAKLLGLTLRHNVNGTDLLPLLCARAAAEKLPLALVGAAPGVAQACADALVRGHPGLSVPIVSHGFLDERASQALVARIASHGRCVVLVDMGTPIQERWAWRLAEARGCTAVTVGGLFDFYSGRVPRAPLFVRELGLEWAFRLAQEPRRLARRYVVGNPAFLARAFLQVLTRGRGARATAPRSLAS